MPIASHRDLTDGNIDWFTSQRKPRRRDEMNWLKNITGEEMLQDNLTFASMYIAVYEHMVDYVVTNIRNFLCDVGIKNGEEFCNETDEYKDEIKHRAVDDHGNKDKTKASFLWLVDNQAISQEDYAKFLEVKIVRNKYAHELAGVIYQGITEHEIALFFDMYELYQKISKWFFLNIEAEIMGYDLPKEADLESVRTAADVVFSMVLNVLYNGKSEEYKAMLAAVEGRNVI